MASNFDKEKNGGWNRTSRGKERVGDPGNIFFSNRAKFFGTHSFSLRPGGGFGEARDLIFSASRTRETKEEESGRKRKRAAGISTRKNPPGKMGPELNNEIAPFVSGRFLGTTARSSVGTSSLDSVPRRICPQYPPFCLVFFVCLGLFVFVSV